MHCLVQSQHKEALPVCCKLSLASFRGRQGGLVEIRFAERLEKPQVLFAQLNIFLSNLGERWIRACISDGP